MPRVKLNSGLFVFVRPSPVGYESSSNFTIQVNLPEYPPEKAALNCGQEHTMVPGRRFFVPEFALRRIINRGHLQSLSTRSEYLEVLPKLMFKSCQVILPPHPYLSSGAVKVTLL